MPNTVYENFLLSSMVEDQYNSHLDLTPFCTIDNSLEGVPGMKRVVNVYTATDGTEKLAMGEGNTKSIEVGFTQKEYEILLAQNRFEYFDEELMKDPLAVDVGMRHAGTDLFNTVNADIFAEFNKGSLEVPLTGNDYFAAYVDAVAAMNFESQDGFNAFSFVHPKLLAAVRKNLKDSLQYVESFARTGYVGTVGGVNLYVKKDAAEDGIIVATRDAVTLFNKKGTEIEQERDGNIRKNSIFSRKYYLAALTDETKVVKINIGA